MLVSLIILSHGRIQVSSRHPQCVLCLKSLIIIKKKIDFSWITFCSQVSYAWPYTALSSLQILITTPFSPFFPYFFLVSFFFFSLQTTTSNLKPFTLSFSTIALSSLLKPFFTLSFSLSSFFLSLFSSLLPCLWQT